MECSDPEATSFEIIGVHCSVSKEHSNKLPVPPEWSGAPTRTEFEFAE